MRFRKEKMNHIFMKHHIIGLPFPAVIHHFMAKDENEHIHDHPFSFTSHVLWGNYTERIWHMDGSYDDVERHASTVHHVRAHTIHEIIHISEGGCYTLIIPEAWERHPGFYRFEDGKVLYRSWNQRKFRELE